MGFGIIQCPYCGKLWTPSKNTLMSQLNAARATKSRLEAEREKLAQSDSAKIDSPSFRAKNLRIKADIMEADYAARVFARELKGDPLQIWQNRYETAMKVLEEMLDFNSFKQVRDAINKACELKR